MATEIVMPQMGESIVEGTITKWLKKPGDKIQRDEPLFEISTDKVDAEIPAPASGVLQEIKVTEGTTVQVNTVVGTIASDGEAAAAPKAAAPEKKASPPAAAPPKAQAPAAAPPKAAPQPPVATRRAEEDHARSSPLVRKIARKNNVDLSNVEGTGLGGRITKQDILAFIEGNEAAGSRPEDARSAEVSAQSTSSAGYETPAPRQEPPRPPALAAFPGDIVPITQMRRIIAQRMIESRRTSAHVHCMFEVDITRIVNLRNKLKSSFEQRNGARLTFMPFFVRAAIIALQQFPIVNASMEGESLRYHRHVNIGIAVA